MALVACACLLLPLQASAATPPLPFLDPTLPPEVRAPATKTATRTPMQENIGLEWSPVSDLQARAKDLVGRLSLEQQVQLLLAEGEGSGTGPDSGGVPELNISGYNWWTECNSGIGVQYPQNVNIAATFNRSIAFLAGRGTGIGLRVRADAEPKDLSCWSPMMK